MAFVLTDDKHYKNIAQTIRDNKELTGQLFPFEMADAINQACAEKYAKGQKSEYDRFWDSFQNYGNRKNYAHAFRGRGSWNDETYNPKYPIIATETVGGVDGANTLMYQTNITDTKVPIYISGSVGAIFNDTMLQHIRKLVVSENTVFLSSSFSASGLIETLIMEGLLTSDLNIGNLKKLTKESVISIFNTLSTEITGKTLTVSKQAVNTAFGINVDDETTYPIGSEYYTLRHSRDNWTVNYI